MSSRTRLLPLAALATVAISVAGCYSLNYASGPGWAQLDGRNFLAGEQNASHFHSIRYESAEINAFLMGTLNRDLNWADADRTLRVQREQNALAWGARTLPQPELLTGVRDVDETVNRLYGAAEGQ